MSCQMRARRGARSTHRPRARTRHRRFGNLSGPVLPNWTRSIRQVTSASRRWGDDRAFLNEDQARGRLLEAASRCITRRGNAQIRMSEVAEEAGVVRSTVYRYFPTREDLLIELLKTRTDSAIGTLVCALAHPDDAALSIPELILAPIALVEGNPLNEALFSGESAALVSGLGSGSEPVIDVLLRHFGPLLDRWQMDGQMPADLDGRETVRWMQAAWLFLLSPVWRARSESAKRQFVEQYVVRALVIHVRT